MKHLISMALTLTFATSLWAAPKLENVYEEVLYNDYQASILSEDHSAQKSVNGFTPAEQSLYVDALWDLTEEGSESALKVLSRMNTFHYELIEKLRVDILKIKYKKASALSPELAEEVRNALYSDEVDIKIIYTLAAYEKEMIAAGHSEIIALAKTHAHYFDIAEDEVRKKEITDDVLTDIFYNSPDVTTYMSGEYIKAVKIFMFCRENRLHPCLMVMRNVHGEIVRNDDGSIWTHKSLASSARGLPSYTRNGNTPAGVMTIDSVMPYADQQMSFGKFRRMMLNFVPKSSDEKHIKSLLPASSHDLDWWKAGVVARNIGRNLFRIHGTLKRNEDPTTPYFPFMRTSGCIAQRENTYGDVTYQDQRDLLDAIMVAMDLEPVYENELKIKGILYIMEMDDKDGAVEASDLALKGIE